MYFVNIATTALAIRILTHNIRYATTSPFEGEELWEVRRPRLINELRFNTFNNPPAFIGLQEVLDNQLNDVLDGLPDFKHIGVGRDDGEKAGEYSPILYRPDVWDLLKFRSVWLSETPEKPSLGWDASSIRILTIGVFEHKESTRRVLALNTHLDNDGSVSRYESAKLINQVALEESEGEFGRLPIFLTGDFNSEPGQEAYQYIAANTTFLDAKNLVPAENIYGNDDTYTAFTESKDDDSRIDFLFVHTPEGNGSYPAQDWAVQNFAVLANKFDDGVYNSDHRAVVGDVLLL